MFLQGEKGAVGGQGKSGANGLTVIHLYLFLPLSQFTPSIFFFFKFLIFLIYINLSYY